MNKIIQIISILIISTLFTACASFQEEYKPLYQVKPEKKSLRGQ